MAVKFDLWGTSDKRSQYPTAVCTPDYTGGYCLYPQARLKIGKWQRWLNFGFDSKISVPDSESDPGQIPISSPGIKTAKARSA